MGTQAGHSGSKADISFIELRADVPESLMPASIMKWGNPAV